MDPSIENKWWHQHLNKVFRKETRYRCCYYPCGNFNKISNKNTCSYRTFLKRMNNKVYVTNLIRTGDEDFQVAPLA